MEKRVYKSFGGAITKAEGDAGIVEAIVSVFGILDHDNPPDLIDLGAFRKTIVERGPNGAKKIRVLNQHHYDEVIGVVLDLREVGRDELPEKILADYPEATGGLLAVTQFVMRTQKGRETFELIKAQAITEWSIGFDVILSKYEKAEGQAYRRIMEARLWEYSPVTWGANPATAVVGMKNEKPESPSEEPVEDPLQKARLMAKAKALELRQKNKSYGGKTR